MRAGPLAALGGVAVAVAATIAAWAAVAVAGGALAPSESSMSTAEVAQALANDTASPSAGPSSPAPATSPVPSAPALTSAPSPTVAAEEKGVPRTLSATGAGGTVVTRCAGGTPYLVYAVPMPGFAVRHDQTGSVAFVSRTHRTSVFLSCGSGTPAATVREQVLTWGHDGDATEAPDH